MDLIHFSSIGMRAPQSSRLYGRIDRDHYERERYVIDFKWTITETFFSNTATAKVDQFECIFKLMVDLIE